MIKVNLDIDTEKKKVAISHSDSGKDVCDYHSINEIATYLCNYMYEYFEELNYNYLFELSNNDKFYIDEYEEKIYIKSYDENEEQQKNEEISLCLVPLEGIILLRLEKTDTEMTDCSIEGHYYLRKLIETLKEENDLSKWQNGIDKYKKYCDEKNITNKELNEKYVLTIPDVFDEEREMER